MNDFTTDSTATTVTRTELYTAEQYAVLEAELARVNSKFDSIKVVLDQISERNTAKANQIEAVKDYLIENYDEMEMHADEIASLLDVELTRDVTYTVSLSATVTVSIKPGEDADSLITDNLYVDSNHGDIQVDDYEIDYTNEA